MSPTTSGVSPRRHRRIPVRSPEAGDPAPTQVGRGEEWSGVRSRREAPVVAGAEARVRRADRVGDGRSGDRTGVAAWIAAVAADADVVQRTGDPDHGAAAASTSGVPASLW